MSVSQHDEPAHRVEYEESDELSFVVVSAVAAVSSSSITEIGPINDIVDPEALCELFATRPDGQARDGGRVSFRLDGYPIEIDADSREVLVYE
ncbi:HalOD1 output domain-containing protein [Halalkalicoccus tibetensis]|uniref:HalOD1 output domain-containing protein n=1 Tax=Halalkalicoccus tibetensis TaxID=175632 RepID=A0ABD5V0E6_9EURY